MSDEQNTEQTPEQAPEQAQTDAFIAEIDRLNGELTKAHARELIPVEEAQRRHAEELHGIVFGPNTGAMSQVGLRSA